MDLEQIRNHALSKPGVKESFPFGENTLVFKVGGKIFLFISLESHPLQFNAKCDPEKAIQLRERYDAVQPGYHMNKQHWNTVTVDGSLDSATLLELIDNSFDLVAPRTKRKKR